MWIRFFDMTENNLVLCNWNIMPGALIIRITNLMPGTRDTKKTVNSFDSG